MNLFEMLKVGLPLVLGWYVVHRLSAARDRDRARREMVAKAADELVANATAAFLMAKHYHSTSRDLEEEQRLKIDLQDMAIRAHQLSAVVDGAHELKVCSAAIADLRKAATGLHFEDEHIVALEADSPQIAEIADAYLTLKRALFALKISQFPK